MAREIKLGAFWYPTGYHIAAWRLPEVPADGGVNFNACVQFAQMAERARFDFIFLPDSSSVRGDDWDIISRGAHRYVAQLEPVSLLSGLAALTANIGLIGTVATTYTEPYHVARQLLSLDHISGGRAGWNLVTSQNEFEAFNFGFAKHPDHQERYHRAREFGAVVRKLWDSWEDNAFIHDKESGVFFDHTRVHPANHQGDYFSVRGPLNVPRSPQGRPVVTQAGASGPGRELAADSGDVVFTAQNDLAAARDFYGDIKRLAAQAGRDPDQVVVLAGLFPFVGKTREEAQSKFDRLQDLIDEQVGLSLLKGQLGEFDLTAYPVDQPLPDIPDTNASKSRKNLLVELARREGYTIRDLYKPGAGARGHLQLTGSPRDIADAMTTWVDASAADGFIIMPPSLPGGMTDFIELVLPELRKRRRFREDYSGSTLRDHLGLPHPGRGE